MAVWLNSFSGCCESGNKELVKLLVRHGSHMKMVNEGGHTPLHCAVPTRCYLSIITYLIDCGFDVHEVTKFVGIDVLQLAAMKGFNEIDRRNTD